MKKNNSPLSEKSACPCCGHAGSRNFYKAENVPVNSVMNCHTREDAQKFPRGNLSLGICHGCGFIWNTSFDPAVVRYSSDCEESQGYSPKFSTFAKDMAQYLVDKYEIKEKTVIEIGCGKGEFLKRICALGRNRGVGFDPAYIPGRKFGHDADHDIEFIADYYSKKYARYKGDLICCRMTLEHISDPDNLIATIRYSIGERADVITFFQVPDVTRILKNCSFEDIYYEHCSYFSPGSLSRLFQKNGFEIIDLKTVFNDQYILLVAKTATKGKNVSHPLVEKIETINGLVSIFEKKLPELRQYWDDQFSYFKQNKKKVIIWGGGSKGVTFLQTIQQADIVEYVVDINPHRQETFMAGSGKRIVSPSFLREFRPDVVIIMNAIYHKEIQHDLQCMELDPLVMTLEITQLHQPMNNV